MYLADFLKTNLTKFAVICLSEKASKGMFLTAREAKKSRNSEDKEKRRREKSNGCTLSFYNSHFGEQFLAEKNCSTQKGPFGNNVIKNPARYIIRKFQFFLEDYL